MLLEMIESNLAEVNHRFDVRMKKFDIMVESAAREAELEMQKAKVIAIQENTSDEEYYFMIEEATDGFVNKVKDVIVKLIEAFKKFINEVKLKVLTFFHKEETNRIIDDAEKKIRFNPFLKNKKVQIVNPDKQIKQIEETRGIIGKIKAKIKGGSNVGAEAVDDAMEKHRGKMVKIAAAAAITTITIGAAIVLFKKKKNSVTDEIDKNAKATVATLEECDKVMKDENITAEAKSAIAAVGKAENNLAKEEVNTKLGFIKNLGAMIKDGVGGAIGRVLKRDNKNAPAINTETDDDVKVESGYDHLDDYRIESVDDFIASLETDLF